MASVGTLRLRLRRRLPWALGATDEGSSMKVIASFLLTLALVSTAFAGACPPEAAGTFPSFLASIQASSDKLIASATSTLVWRVIGNADENRPTITKLRSTDFRAKISSNWPASNSQLKVRSSGAKDKEATVVVAKPDTDYQLVFYFRRLGNCWRLTEVEDQSL